MGFTHGSLLTSFQLPPQSSSYLAAVVGARSRCTGIRAWLKGNISVDRSEKFEQRKVPSRGLLKIGAVPSVGDFNELSPANAIRRITQHGCRKDLIVFAGYKKNWKIQVIKV